MVTGPVKSRGHINILNKKTAKTWECREIQKQGLGRSILDISGAGQQEVPRSRVCLKIQQTGKQK